MTELQAIVIFDGICNLCDGAVRFIVRHDPNASFRFVALQSPAGQALLAENQLTDVALDSVIVIKPERCYLRSDAVIEIAKSLTGIGALLQYLHFFPKPLRDGAYDLLAKYRYQIFGKKCVLPTDSR